MGPEAGGAEAAVGRRGRDAADSASMRILRAARHVFARHPFKAASTRMIAEEAGVDHPLIHYYYGSKEKLFETVVQLYYDEFQAAHVTWLEGLDKMMPRPGLALYIDRLIAYCFAHPEALQMFILNISPLGVNKDIPGYDRAIAHFGQIAETTLKKLPLPAPRAEIEMFIYCFHNLTISFVGARALQAEVMGMSPDSPEYRERFKSAMLTMFEPWIEQLAFGKQPPAPPAAPPPAS
jgi:TetR/AcrR family transcriptional regulator